MGITIQTRHRFANPFGEERKLSLQRIRNTTLYIETPALLATHHTDVLEGLPHRWDSCARQTQVSGVRMVCQYGNWLLQLRRVGRFRKRNGRIMIKQGGQLFNSMEKNVENLRVPQLIKKLMSSVDVF
jgi:hypothetical protein